LHDTQYHTQYSTTSTSCEFNSLNEFKIGKTSYFIVSDNITDALFTNRSGTQDPREDNKPVPRKIKLRGSKVALIL
jgi:hypothetical protein